MVATALSLFAVVMSVFSCQVSVLLGNWQQVLNYYSKAEATHEMTEVSLSLVPRLSQRAWYTLHVHALIMNIYFHRIS